MQRTFCMDFKRISHYDFKLLYDTDSINLVARNYIHCVVSFNCLPKLQEETFMNFQSYHIILDEKTTRKQWYWALVSFIKCIRASCLGRFYHKFHFEFASKFQTRNLLFMTFRIIFHWEFRFLSMGKVFIKDENLIGLKTLFSPCKSSLIKNNRTPNIST